MVTLSRLYLRGVRDGGSPGLTCSLPGQRRRAQPEPYVQPPYLGRYPGPAFPGLPTYFPTVSGWGGRGARRRAGLDRPPPLRGPGGVVPAEEPSGQDAAGAAEVAESISAALEGFEAGPCPAAPVGNAERPGRAPPEGGGFSRGPARPRGGSGCRLRLPLAFFHPNLSLPGRSPLPGRPMDKCGSRAGGDAGVVAVCRGFSRASPRVPLSEPDWCVLRVGVPQRVRWVPPACSVPDGSLSKLCGES